MAFGWLRKIIPDKNTREIKKMVPLADRVLSFEPAIKRLSDPQLQANQLLGWAEEHVARW